MPHCDYLVGITNIAKHQCADLHQLSFSRPREYVIEQPAHLVARLC